MAARPAARAIKSFASLALPSLAFNSSYSLDGFHGFDHADLFKAEVDDAVDGGGKDGGHNCGKSKAPERQIAGEHNKVNFGHLDDEFL